MHNHNSKTPGFGVFLGEAADGGGDGFPQPHGGGLLTGVYFRGKISTERQKYSQALSDII